ncbi:MAG: potassium channel beta subunit family protein [Verrucomicrobiota bacterium]
MEYRKLGKSGLKISALSYGAWVTFGSQLGVDQAGKIMAEAYDAGVNFFDNAEAYANGEAEEIMGRVLQKMGWRRDSYCVSSKVFFGVDERRPTQRGLSRKHVVEACHAAMQRLQVDYLDLYFCHRRDPETPIEEVVWTMTSLIQQGKVFYWGTSEWSAQEIQEAHAVAARNNLIGPTMEQPQYNMFHRERVEEEYANLYAGSGLGTTIWSPLASGLLTGKYNKEIPKDSRGNLEGYEWLRNRFEGEGAREGLNKVDRLMPIAEEIGTTMPRMALAWCLKNPNVSTVITGASKPEQVKENMQAVEDVDKLTPEIMERIEAVLGDGSDE